MTAMGYVTGWTRPALTFVIFTLSVQLLPGLIGLWQFSRPAFDAGAWWQPVTSQWVHLSMSHAVVNAAAMVLLLLAFDQLAGWRTQMISLLGGYLGAAIVIAMDSSCVFYAGASGALHGFLAGNAFSVFVSSLNQNSTLDGKYFSQRQKVAWRALALVALIILVAKLWFQHVAANGATGWLGFATYYPAHEAGSLGGLVASAVSRLLSNALAKHRAS